MWPEGQIVGLVGSGPVPGRTRTHPYDVRVTYRRVLSLRHPSSSCAPFFFPQRKETHFLSLSLSFSPPPSLPLPLLGFSVSVAGGAGRKEGRKEEGGGNLGPGGEGTGEEQRRQKADSPPPPSSTRVSGGRQQQNKSLPNQCWHRHGHTHSPWRHQW